MVLDGLFRRRELIIQKEFIEKLGTHSLVSMLQAEKKKELLVKVARTFSYLNRVAIRHKCKPAFINLVRNVETKKAALLFKNEREIIENEKHQNQLAIQKHWELEKQELLSQIDKMKLSHHKLINENEEIKEEAEELSNSNKHLEHQNRLLSDKVVRLEKELETNNNVEVIIILTTNLVRGKRVERTHAYHQELRFYY